MENKKKLSIAFLIIIALVLVSAVIYFSGILRPDSIRQDSFEIALVHRGDILSTTPATGVVESENEVLVLSPATSIVKSILKEAGNFVEEGDVILQLNPEPVQADIERLTDQLEMKRNNLERTRLNAQSAKLDLDFNEETKKLKITSLKSQLADQNQLLEVGGISPAKVEETKQEITLAEKDLSILLEKNAIRLKQLVAEEEGLLLQIRMDEKVLNTNRDLLQKMNIKAPSSGIILNIAVQVGEKINADRMMVQLSDLTSFKIIGSVDEKAAAHVKTGKKVLVLVEDEKLTGTIGSTTPMVANNKVQFNVHLDQSSHPKLIANQNVVLQIIDGQKENVLRVKKPAEINPGKKSAVFVVDGSTAVKKEVTFGIIGDEYCEIVEGLEEGDAVISGDTGAFRHFNEIEIKK